MVLLHPSDHLVTYTSHSIELANELINYTPTLNSNINSESSAYAKNVYAITSNLSNTLNWDMSSFLQFKFKVYSYDRDYPTLFQVSYQDGENLFADYIEKKAAHTVLVLPCILSLPEYFRW